jgi:S-adenosyl methyltransferase
VTAGSASSSTSAPGYRRQATPTRSHRPSPRRPASSTWITTPSCSRTRALLIGTPEGLVDYLHADLRDPGEILPAAARTLDFSLPIALMMLMVPHIIPDADGPHAIVGRLLSALPRGSHLALSHPPSDILPTTSPRRSTGSTSASAPGQSMTARSRDEVARFFSGLELVPPGLVQVHQWRRDGRLEPDAPASIWCAVGRKK